MRYDEETLNLAVTIVARRTSNRTFEAVIFGTHVSSMNSQMITVLQSCDSSHIYTTHLIWEDTACPFSGPVCPGAHS